MTRFGRAWEDNGWRGLLTWPQSRKTWQQEKAAAPKGCCIHCRTRLLHHNGQALRLGAVNDRDRKRSKSLGQSSIVVYVQYVQEAAAQADAREVRAQDIEELLG